MKQLYTKRRHFTLSESTGLRRNGIREDSQAQVASRLKPIAQRLMPFASRLPQFERLTAAWSDRWCA